MRKFILLGLDGACPDIIDKAIADGLMPNFQSLRECGCWADNIPFPSAVTPGNWTCIATGSKPRTNGISDFTVHAPGEPLDEAHEAFTKGNSRAQFVWDAYSERGLRCATISYPGSLPQTAPLHLSIGNDGSPTENSRPYTIAPSRAIVAGPVDPVGPYGWNEHERVVLEPVAPGAGPAGFAATHRASFSIGALNPGFSGAYPVELYLGQRDGQAAASLVDGGTACRLSLNEWSPFVGKTFACHRQHLGQWHSCAAGVDTVIGRYRVRLTKWDPTIGTLLLYITPVYPASCFASDPELGELLDARHGPYSDNLPISRLLMGWLDDAGFYDEFRAQGVWQAQAALALVNELDYAGVLTKWHAFDKFYHFYMHRIDPAAPGFVPDQCQYYEELHRMLLCIADEMVGIVRQGLREDTSLVVVSDHGLMASRRCAWVNRFLAQHGYICFAPDAAGHPRVDWQRTRAYVSAFLLLNVNLKGRDPHGIVEPGTEYECLKQELIDLLRSWKDPQTGRHVMTDVFDPVKDGAFYGLGSDLDGDIRYFTAPGTTLFRSTAAHGDEALTDVAGPYLGDHGSCRPTTRFGIGGEPGIFYAAGRGFRPTGRRAAPVFPCDIMPTLLHVAGQAPLRDQEGAVLHDLL